MSFQVPPARRPWRAAPHSLTGLAGALLLACAATPSLAQEGEHHDEEEAVEVEGLVVQATRSRRRVQDEPIRVEVISQEEIEEKILMRPGNISMLLAETGGLRVQVTSPGLGSANIRVQGMRGRYTQLLADGLPLYGGQASSLGLLQVPPSDLGQVEVIKGAASALYGSSALAGVINLVSRRPGDEPGGEITLNATSRGGQDVAVYAATPLSQEWSGSMLATFNRQTAADLDDDGWADMPGYGRVSMRPRLFWQGEDGASAFVTVGAMQEERRGGTRPGRTAPNGLPFPQSQDTTRLDGGLIYERPLTGGAVAQLRASGVAQEHSHRFGSLIEDDQHRTFLVEGSVSGQRGGVTWIAGAAVQTDDYRSDAFSAFDYDYSTPGLFGQVEWEIGSDLTVAASGRWDDHSEFGAYFSPRLSLLYRPGPFKVRASWGRGFYAPAPFVEETEAAGLSRLDTVLGLDAETAETASLDFGYAAGPIEASLTLFGSDIDNAVQLQTVGPNLVRLLNANGVTRTRGAEVLLRYRWEDFTVTGSYLLVDAAEPDPSGPGRREVPLTPRHSAGLVAVWEQHDRGRIGIEAYYTGEQPLDGNPYRSEGKPYLELGAMAEIVLGRYRLFLNLENILDVRQTRHDPLLLPARAPDGRWTVDAWAPLEGFTANGGLRIRF